MGAGMVGLKRFLLILRIVFLMSFATDIANIIRKPTPPAFKPNFCVQSTLS